MRTQFLVLIYMSLTDNILAVVNGSQIYISNDPCFRNFKLLCMSKILPENGKKGYENGRSQNKRKYQILPLQYFFLEPAMTNYCPNHFSFATKHPFFLLKYEVMAAVGSFENHPSPTLSNGA